MEVRTSNCNGIKVSINVTGNQPRVMTISSEGGLWVEVPYNDGEIHHSQEFYYNIENSQIAVTGINHHGLPYLQIYRDYDFYKAKVAKHSLRCTLVSVN